VQLGKLSINYPHHKAPSATPVIGAFLFQSLYALIEARILTVADLVEATAPHVLTPADRGRKFGKIRLTRKRALV
jgi:hypothetical protein